MCRYMYLFERLTAVFRGRFYRFKGDVSWQEMVLPTVAEMIKAKRLFGFQPSAGT